MKEAISLQPWRGSLGEGCEDQEQGSAEEPNKSEPRLTPHDGNKKVYSPRQKPAGSPHSAPQRGCRRFSMISLRGPPNHCRRKTALSLGAPTVDPRWPNRGCANGPAS